MTPVVRRNKLIRCTRIHREITLWSPTPQIITLRPNLQFLISGIRSLWRSYCAEHLKCNHTMTLGCKGINPADCGEWPVIPFHRQTSVGKETLAGRHGDKQLFYYVPWMRIMMMRTMIVLGIITFLQYSYHLCSAEEPGWVDTGHPASSVPSATPNITQ